MNVNFLKRPASLISLVMLGAIVVVPLFNSAQGAVPGSAKVIQFYATSPAELKGNIDFNLNGEDGKRIDWSISWGDGKYEYGEGFPGDGISYPHDYSASKNYTVEVCAENQNGGECKTRNIKVGGPTEKCSVGNTQCSDCIDNDNNGKIDFGGIDKDGKIFPPDTQCNDKLDDFEGGPATPYFHALVKTNKKDANWVVLANSGPRYKSPAFSYVREYQQEGQMWYEWKTNVEINGQGNVTLQVISLANGETYKFTQPWKTGTQNYGGNSAQSPLVWVIDFGSTETYMDLKANGGNYDAPERALILNPGDTANITWRSAGVSSCYSHNGYGTWAQPSIPLQNPSGSSFVMPNLPGTMLQYSATCNKPGGTTTDNVYIFIEDPSSDTAPGRPTVSGFPACSDTPYQGTISWTGTPHPTSGFFVDISTDIGFATYYTKQVTSGLTTNTNGFTNGSGQTLILNGGTTYYARVSNDDHAAGSFSPSSGPWTVPTCSDQNSHRTCQNNMCVVVPGPGQNGCTTDSQCSGNACTFTASPERLITPPANASTLTWECTGVRNCRIDQSVGSVAVEGSTQVSPSVTTLYTLTCDNVSGGGTTTATASTEVSVRVFRFEGGVLKEVLP